jgi:hypothetical protein
MIPFRKVIKCFHTHVVIHKLHENNRGQAIMIFKDFFVIIEGTEYSFVPMFLYILLE